MRQVETPGAVDPDHRRGLDLWQTANGAYVTIEEAGRLGIPIEMIASAACPWAR
jgi:hypothetical protein